MLQMKKLALENEGIAYPLIGQAILDEAKIGPDAIRISYYSEEEARYLWEVEKRLKHLWNLEKEGKVSKNINVIRKNVGLAELWLASKS